MQYKKACLLLTFFFLFHPPALAQEMVVPQQSKQEFVKAQVIEIQEEGVNEIETYSMLYQHPFQTVKVRILEGKNADTEATIDYSGASLNSFQKVKKGQIVVVLQNETIDGDPLYEIVDKYRINELAMIAALFLFLVILLSRWKGVGSILGMLFSLAVILKFIVPQILAGKDPLTISILGSIAILVTSIYLAHGFSKQTSIAVVATSLTLVITGFLSVIFVKMTNLSGISNEDTQSLLFGGPTSTINFRGLLLGGMIIGFLGVLDDITTALAATVFELKKVNPALKFKQLIRSSLNIGVEHISSLVNTLVLAYAGASLPIFLFLVLNPGNYPVWFMVNSEFIAEEIVRTLVGSIGLLCAVPITTVIASWVVTKKIQTS